MRRKGIVVLSFCCLFLPLKSQDTIEKIVQDDPVIAAWDSILISKYFESAYTDQEITGYGFTPDQVVTYPDSVYKSRLEKLNALTPIEFSYNVLTERCIKRYAKMQKQVARMLGLSKLYFPIFEEMLAKYDIPQELKYLPIVESALNPRAKSSAGAMGLWQFMFTTGKQNGLTINSYIDERRDLIKSTEAACKYLKFLYGIYDDWNLALAAYNSGPGNVNKAIRRSGGKENYWQIIQNLPRETQSYVPLFVAVTYIMNYSAEHNIKPVNPSMKYFAFDTVWVNKQVRFDQISEIIDIPVTDLEYLNPAYSKNLIPKTGHPMHIYLPANKVGDFLVNEEAIYNHKLKEPVNYDAVAALKNYKVSSGGKKNYVVKSGDVLGTIAEKHGCSLLDLKRWNNLRSNKIYQGQKLYVRGAKQTKITPSNTKSKTVKKNWKSVTYYKIKDGDTLWDIAALFPGVSVNNIMQANLGLNPKNLKLGRTIKIPVF